MPCNVRFVALRGTLEKPASRHPRVIAETAPERHRHKRAPGRRLLPPSPHFVLAAAVAAVLAVETARGTSTRGFSILFPIAQAALVGAALLVAWRWQDGLELRRVLVLAVLLQAGWIAVHLGLGVQADGDSASVYPSQGRTLLHGDYPRSEYPPGAVLLFALDAWLGGGSTRVSHAFLMIVPQLVAVAAIWQLNTRWSRWFATLVALWPLNAFFWEFRYDLAPTAALVFGLLLAQRGRWGAAGACLGLGAALKWVPALSLVGIAFWLLCRGRRREAARHIAAGAGVFAVVNLPFLLWRPDAFAAAYSLQAGRGMTAESFAYLPLRLLGLARVDTEPYYPAVRPAWADSAVLVVQAIVIVGLLVAVANARRCPDAVALAALLPAAFLLTNRVFSAQFLVLLLAVWAVAGSLVVRTRREQLAIGAIAAGATVGNVLVYPAQAGHWAFWSGVLFLFACAVTLALVMFAAIPRREPLAAALEPAGGAASPA
jgi:hypothetical protein